MGRSKAIVLHQQHHSRKNLDAVYRPANIRIRRAILAGKRGPTTPVPSWKLYENPSYDGIIAGTEAASRQITISARKLAATLWELQEVPLSRGPPSTKSTGRSYTQSHGSGTGHRHRESVGSPKHLMLPPPSPTTPVPQAYAKPTSTKSSDSHRRSPYSESVAYHSRRPSEEMYTCETPPRHSFEMETQKQQQQQQQQDQMIDENAERVKTGALESVSNSGDLIKMINHIRDMEPQCGSAPLAAVLRLQLEHTRHRVRELEVANKAIRREFEMLVESTENDRATWRAKEQEKYRAAIVAAKQEVEEERRQKRKVEVVNMKLAQQLDEVKVALSRAMKDLEKERKARQLMEDVCDELAREIGQDKAEVEQLKREAEKVREEVEEERRMLQMAEVWREERVQMKLAEARHELEEKNSALEKLTCELEEFLHNKPALGDSQGQRTDVQKATMLRAAVDSLRKQPPKAAHEGGGSSGEEDLHSIDLNKESLFDRTQGNRWTYKRQQQQKQQFENLEWSEKKPEHRRKGLRGRRRLRRNRTFDENLIAREGSELVRDGNEQENGPSGSCSDEREDYIRASPSFGGGRIDTIPEQQELYMGSQKQLPRHNNKTDGNWHGSSASPKDDDFALGFAAQKRSQDSSGCRTPTLSPLLHSGSFPMSTVATPQRNSWSSGDLNPHESTITTTKASLRGAGTAEWPRVRDNSLRAKLLEAKMEDPHHRQHHHHHHRHQRTSNRDK